MTSAYSRRYRVLPGAPRLYFWLAILVVLVIFAVPFLVNALLPTSAADEAQPVTIAQAGTDWEQPVVDANGRQLTCLMDETSFLEAGYQCPDATVAYYTITDMDDPHTTLERMVRASSFGMSTGSAASFVDLANTHVILDWGARIVGFVTPHPQQPEAYLYAQVSAFATPEAAHNYLADLWRAILGEDLLAEVSYEFTGDPTPELLQKG